jgi:sulfite exporter TauE/SafE
MPSDFAALSVTAVALGFFHCLSGPDHYVPFVAMARIGDWSLRKTLLITLRCGLGHVASSVVLGCGGILLGLVLFELTEAEQVRGEIAGWLLLVFGLSYLAGGLVSGFRHRALSVDTKENAPDSSPGARSPWWMPQRSMVPWALFLIFLFGPCEPLIPLMMYPASQADLWGAIWITSLFGATTLMTMTALVALLHQGMSGIRFPSLSTFGHRFGHALAGLAIVCCGVAVLSGL